jgi:hypothetical protein
MTVHEAHEAVKRADAVVAEAKTARSEAFAKLEAALAAIGWRRFGGAFTQDATPLYVSLLYPNASLDLQQLLEVLEQQESVRTSA